MSNLPCSATVANASLPQNSTVYSGQLKNASSDRLAIGSIRISAGGVNTLTKPIHATVYRVLTASISENTPTAGTVAKRNVVDAGSISGVSVQSLAAASSITSPELLDGGWFKPDGGSYMFNKGYYVDPLYSIYVKVDDTNNAATIPLDTTFDFDK